MVRRLNIGMKSMGHEGKRDAMIKGTEIKKNLRKFKKKYC
jgi:hypothetical protein